MCSSGECNAVRTTKLSPVDPQVRVTHPFHPWRGRELEVLRRDIHYGEDRVFYRSQYGHVCSLPTVWTSLIERPVYGSDRRAPLFLTSDLLELVELVEQWREQEVLQGREKAKGGVK